MNKIEDKLSTYFKDAYLEAGCSPDPSSQCGALIVDPKTGHPWATGCNTICKGVELTDEMLVRPLKYKWIEHAERNAIYAMARNNEGCEGKTMVAPWAACVDCGRAIAQSGISVLWVHKQRMDIHAERWAEDIDLSHKIMKAAGVDIRVYDDPELFAPSILVDGVVWSPLTGF